MPSGKTHDLITLILALPVAAGAYFFASRISVVGPVAAAFVFGGLMFGPDLDTRSRQTARWSIFHPIWLPYRTFFAHRSRWTHGLIFGTAIRVIYFAGIITILSYLGMLTVTMLTGGGRTGLMVFAGAWKELGRWVEATLGAEVIYLSLFGMWIGAASHTLTDLAGTYIRTGRGSKIS
jgi:uncharacterized metal-binding protein